MASPGIVTVKRFTFRDRDEEWSNRYHFGGAAPSDAAAWRTFADGLISAERLILRGDTKIVRALCYEDTDNDSVYTYNLALFGGEVTGADPMTPPDDYMPGDVASWIRWDTGRRTSTGKPIYLRKYFHNAGKKSGTTDQIDDGTKAAMETFAADCVSGLTGGFVIADSPSGDAVSDPVVSLYLTTRTLKRRGRRP